MPIIARSSIEDSFPSQPGPRMAKAPERVVKIRRPQDDEAPVPTRLPGAPNDCVSPYTYEQGAKSSAGPSRIRDDSNPIWRVQTGTYSVWWAESDRRERLLRRSSRLEGPEGHAEGVDQPSDVSTVSAWLGTDSAGGALTSRNFDVISTNRSTSATTAEQRPKASMGATLRFGDCASHRAACVVTNEARSSAEMEARRAVCDVWASASSTAEAVSFASRRRS
jgi:hypothetical protein